MNDSDIKDWTDSVTALNDQSAELGVARKHIIEIMEKHIRSVFPNADNIIFTDDFRVIEVAFRYYSDVILHKDDLEKLGMDVEVTIGTDHQLYNVVVLKLHPFGKESDT